MAQQKAQILVTDDEQSIRNALRDILEFEGYKVLEAGSGQEAFDVIAEQQVDLMFLDIKMKGMDGMEVLQKLDEENHHFPVIMISGHGNIEIAVKATKMGAFDF